MNYCWYWQPHIWVEVSHSTGTNSTAPRVSFMRCSRCGVVGQLAHTLSNRSETPS